MGLLNWLGLGTGTRDVLASGIATPWAEGTSLNQIALSEIFGTELTQNLPLTRGEAISIPAVSKARNLLVASIAKFPLKALNETGELEPAAQPSFLYRSDTAVTPYDRMAWTVDSLIFFGLALWEVERGASGQITTAAYVPQDQWSITEGHVLIREQQVPEDGYILFSPPHEGLLNIGTSTLRHARDIERNLVRALKNPIPLTALKAADGARPTAQEIADTLSTWRSARNSEDGSVAWLPETIDIQVFGTEQSQAPLFVEGRNAARTDVGSFLNVRAAMLDGTIGVDSLTYSTKEGEKNAFYEFDLPYWTDPIEARLSMDDVVPRGQRVRFQKYSVTADTTPATDIPELD